jgi:hypothetical protein
MFRQRWIYWDRFLLGCCVILFIHPCRGRAQDKDGELRALIEQQGKEIQELKKQLEALKTAPGAPAATSDSAQPQIDDSAVKRIVADYLKENPGAGMPPGVQTGYEWGKGFVIRSVPDPQYIPWDGGAKIPFELRIHGRIQMDYYGYKVTDDENHLTGLPASANANTRRFADESVLEIKRARLYLEGTAFDPNLRYQIQIDGNTRGLGGFQNNKVLQTSGTTDPNDAAVSPVGGGVTVDHAVRLFGAWVAYDFHPFGGDGIEGRPRYVPTLTLFGGKSKPFFGLEEWLGHGNQQFVEYSMADYYFDADDDNYQTMAGIQARALEDRLFLQAVVTNGNESQTPAVDMDAYPAFNGGFYYDFGGTWNEAKGRWDLFGETLSDLDYSYDPVVRVGGAVNLVPMGRRSLYGDAEQSRLWIMPAQPGGTRLYNVLNGDGAAAAPPGSHAVDSVDAFYYDAFIASHWRGFSLSNEWWLRTINNFHTTPNGLGNIIYISNFGNSLFPANHALVDYGTQLQGGYFVVPKKFELVARWSWIRGDSGDINGNGTVAKVTVPGVMGTVNVVNGAFRNFHEVDEYMVGFNYYLKGELLKWSTDVGIYRGGNPVIGGASAAGFLTGLDGWMLRTQLQFAF